MDSTVRLIRQPTTYGPSPLATSQAQYTSPIGTVRYRKAGSFNAAVDLAQTKAIGVDVES